MLANHTDRVYCDVEDLKYAVGKLKDASEARDYAASKTMKLNESLSALNESFMYTGAAIALDIIATQRVDNAADFMVKFERHALGKFTNDDKE